MAPRIRCVKPDEDQAEDLGSVSRDARFLYVKLRTVMDDEGRSRAASRLLASLLYPYDTDVPGLIDGWLAELQKINRILIYAVDGETYLVDLKWLDHQRIDRPTKSKIPPPLVVIRETSRSLAIDSDESRNLLQEVEVEVDTERIGEEPESKGITAHMIAKEVLIRAKITSDLVFIAVQSQAQLEIGEGDADEESADQITASMALAWAKFRANAAKMEYSWAAQKFFGEGYWRDESGWPWKAETQGKGSSRPAGSFSDRFSERQIA